ncbi:MAG: TonB family protein [Desulfobacteraceae bacterium]|jgi:bla regulator protein BlaR1
MGNISFDTAAMLRWLFESTLSISIFVCIILVLKTFTKAKFPAWWSYGLWLLLVFRMFVPWSIKSPVSILNFFSTSPGDDTYIPFLMEQVVSLPLIENTSNVLSLDKIMLFVWFAGILFFSISILLKNLMLRAAIKRITPVADRAVIGLFDECRRLLAVQRNVELVVTDRVKSPALFGYLKPRLLFPLGFLNSLGKDELHCVFLHELGHLKSHDIGVSWLVTVLQIVYWFNPFVWYAFYLMRIDQEVACDAYVLSRINQVNPADYAGTIVGLLDRFIRNRQLPSLAGIIENKSQIRRRIALIMTFKKYTYKKSIASVFMLIAIGLVFFTSSNGLSSVNNDISQKIIKHDSLYSGADSLAEVDHPPRPVRVPAPMYPFEAASKGITGRVILKLVVGTDGYAHEPEIFSSEPEGIFDEAALEAVEEYVFQPAEKNGRAVNCIVRLPIKFDLSVLSTDEMVVNR